MRVWKGRNIWKWKIKKEKERTRKICQELLLEKMIGSFDRQSGDLGPRHERTVEANKNGDEIYKLNQQE
jgi:hypothetical protein